MKLKTVIEWFLDIQNIFLKKAHDNFKNLSLPDTKQPCSQMDLIGYFKSYDPLQAALEELKKIEIGHDLCSLIISTIPQIVDSFGRDTENLTLSFINLVIATQALEIRSKHDTLLVSSVANDIKNYFAAFKEEYDFNNQTTEQ